MTDYIEPEPIIEPKESHEEPHEPVFIKTDDYYDSFVD
jgi:hypothetical protein